MTRNDIIRMAWEAGLPYAWISETGVLKWSELERFADLVAAAEREHNYALIETLIDAEREACAKVAEETVCDTHLPTGVKIYGTRAAKAIRARGEK